MARGRVQGARRAAVVAALLLGAVAAAASGAARGPVERCLDLLRSGRDAAGAIRVDAVLGPSGGEEEIGGGEELQARLEVTVAVDADLAAVPRLLVSLVSVPIDGEPELWQVERTLELAAGDEAWILRATVDLPADFVDSAVHVQDPGSGRWGAARVRLDDPAPAPAVRATIDEIEEPAGEPGVAEASAAPAGVIRLVPPGAGRLTGRVRVRALPGSPEVARVDFLLDGEVVESDAKTPFSRAVDLGPDAAPRELAVVAYSGGGRELGRDALTVNGRGGFDVRLRRVADAAGGDAAVAEVSVPAGSTLAAVEFYRNEALLATRREPPYRIDWPAEEPLPGDYLRAVARLDDGGSVEDVVMLAAGEQVERVEVNLVQVFALVTDRGGEPVEGLTRGDFTVRQGGRVVELERFARADSVPLSLGLVVDTSESMWPLMLETKQAGAEFLVDTLAERDRAFLIDFDTRPRLAQGLTEDLRDLLNRFAGLEAGGFTALYDAVVFAMLQFDDGPGRRALVVLTDGDDYRSQFTARRCIDVGRQLGVAVYFVDLSGIGRTMRSGGWQWSRGGLPKLDLDGIAAATGGRVHYISELAELATVYDDIERELRSQYLLAFASPRNLTAEELQSIEVEVAGDKRWKVRRVVGAAAG